MYIDFGNLNAAIKKKPTNPFIQSTTKQTNSVPNLELSWNLAKTKQVGLILPMPHLAVYFQVTYECDLWKIPSIEFDCLRICFLSHPLNLDIEIIVVFLGLKTCFFTYCFTFPFQLISLFWTQQWCSLK